MAIAQPFLPGFVMTDLYTEALSTFSDLLKEAESSQEREPTAMTLATATPTGAPSARIVLLKAHDARGFVFYSHLGSRKGQELMLNPGVALLFLWRSLRVAGVQVRIEGVAQQVSDEEADAYFSSRPRMSQIGAWASAQSQTLYGRDDFEDRIAQVEAEFEGRDVPRPESWSGTRVVPHAFEFWYGAQFRLHERWRYECDAAGVWAKRMLYP